MAKSLSSGLFYHVSLFHSFNTKTLFRNKCVSCVLNFAHLEKVYCKTYKTSAHHCGVYEVKDKLQSTLANQWNSFYQQYEEFVGLADVQNAQLKVKEAEKFFLAARAEERQAMRKILKLRDQLKHVRERLSHVNYSDALYPQLANEQHELVTMEDTMQTELDVIEEKERDTFMKLSAAMRDSYEKERARVERTKNWSLIGTVVGAILGMFGSIYINKVRTNDLKDIIINQAGNENLKESLDQVIPHAQVQYEDIKEEIRQLQTVLLNKLLQTTETSTGNGISETSIVQNDNSDTMQSIIKVLKSFEAQLSYLSEQSKTDRNDELLKAIAALSKQFDQLVDDKQFQTINSKLDDVRSILLNNVRSSDGEALKTENIVQKKESNSFSCLKSFAMLSVAFSLVYYIVTI